MACEEIFALGLCIQAMQRSSNSPASSSLMGQRKINFMVCRMMLSFLVRMAHR